MYTMHKIFIGSDGGQSWGLGRMEDEEDEIETKKMKWKKKKKKKKKTAALS